MRLEIVTTNAPACQEWRTTIERHCSLTLRPLGERVKRVDLSLRRTVQDGLPPFFVSELRAETDRRPVYVRIQHSDAKLAIALAFSRARRDLLRQFGQ